jgi:hypothetical protein
MFTKTNINSNYGWDAIWEGITEYYTNAIDANETNDIIVCGAFGELLHFNGYSWKSYRNKLQLFTGSFLEIKIKENLVVAIGYDSQKAIITIGHR